MLTTKKEKARMRASNHYATRLEARRKAGVCTKCGGKRDTPRRLLCGACRSAFNAYALQRRANFRKAGVCTKCGGKRDDPQYIWCSGCRAEGAAIARRPKQAELRKMRKRKLESKRRKAGVCTKCGGKRDDTSYIQCTNCRQYFAEAQRRSRSRHKTRTAPAQEGPGRTHVTKLTHREGEGTQ